MLPSRSQWKEKRTKEHVGGFYGPGHASPPPHIPLDRTQSQALLPKSWEIQIIYVSGKKRRKWLSTNTQVFATPLYFQLRVVSGKRKFSINTDWMNLQMDGWMDGEWTDDGGWKMDEWFCCQWIAHWFSWSPSSLHMETLAVLLIMIGKFRAPFRSSLKNKWAPLLGRFCGRDGLLVDL